MSKQKLMLTIDFGTQSVRVSIFNKKGEILKMEKVPYNEPYFSTKPGYAEQNPDYYYDCLIQASKKLCEDSQDLLKDCSAIAMTTFRDSPVFLGEDYKPVRPTILWLDQRQANLDEKLPFYCNAIFKVIGMGPTIVLNRKRTPALWLKENEPENWNKIKKYVALSTYFNYLLTGELKDSPANQTGHYPIDFKHRRWYKTDNNLKGRIFGVKKALLCDLVPLGQAIGKITKKCHEETGLPEGLPLLSIGPDKSCETLGLGCVEPNEGSVSYGTACTIEVTNKKYHEPEPFLPAYPACIPGYYNMDVQIYRGYWMLSWFMQQFGFTASIEATIQHLAAEEVMNEKIKAIPPGANGLVLQPYWGPGLHRPEARGAILGFSEVHTKEHVYRAIIEGIAFALREALEGIEKRQHRKVKILKVSGGGSKSDVICQITADIFNRPVSRVQTYETSSLGAAMAGYIALGEFKTCEEAVEAMSHTTTTFTPNKADAKKYEELFRNVYLKIYPQNRHIYKSLWDYSKKYI